MIQIRPISDLRNKFTEIEAIVNDGNLNKIFFMSDINMQAVYGVSLEELIDNYCKESVNEKVKKKYQ